MFRDSFGFILIVSSQMLRLQQGEIQGVAPQHRSGGEGGETSWSPDAAGCRRMPPDAGARTMQKYLKDSKRSSQSSDHPKLCLVFGMPGGHPTLG